MPRNERCTICDKIFLSPDAFNSICTDCAEKLCVYCGNDYRFGDFYICLSCALEIIDNRYRIRMLMNEGHPFHCANRQVSGDGECECGLYKRGYDPYVWITESGVISEDVWNNFLKNEE